VNPIIHLERDTAKGVSVTLNQEAFLRMLRYAAKSHSLGKRIQGEDARESSYYQQKESCFKKRQSCATNSPHGGKHFMPGTNL
jgi:hypothetical protein